MKILGKKFAALKEFMIFEKGQGVRLSAKDIELLIEHFGTQEQHKSAGITIVKNGAFSEEKIRQRRLAANKQLQFLITSETKYLTYLQKNLAGRGAMEYNFDHYYKVQSF